MLTKYARSKHSNHQLGLAAWTMPATVYVVLFTADPTDDGAFTDEVPSGRGYARQNATAVMVASSAGAPSVSGSDVNFGPCSSADWGYITHAGLADSVTLAGGNLINFIELPENDKRTIKIGDTFRVPSGLLKLLIGGEIA